MRPTIRPSGGGSSTEAIAHTDGLLAHVRRRREALSDFEAELNERRQRHVHHLRELGEAVS